MILTGIRLGIAAKRLKSLPGREVVPGKEWAIEKVGIILEAQDEQNLSSFEDMFRNFGCKQIAVETVFCIPSEKNYVPAKGISFTAGDIGWTGKITNAAVAAFIEQDLDLLIAFTNENNKLAAFLMEASGATVKVGNGKGDAWNADVVISTSPTEIDIFVAELKKYLRIIIKST